MRALRHYEQIGLLTPARRTEAGHRVYGHDQVERLYRIIAPRSLGLALPAINEALEIEQFADVIRRHLGHLEREADRVVVLRDRLRWLAAHLDEPLPADRLLALIDAITQLEQCLTAPQLDRLAARRARLGSAGVRRSRREWTQLATSLRREMQAGAPPSAPAVQKLARLARQYIEAFTGGDQAMQHALQQMRKLQLPDDFEGWDSYGS
ncbi:MAG: MerR family transcriptional regulator [Solirubrobacteraceae bacterium]